MFCLVAALPPLPILTGGYLLEDHSESVILFYMNDCNGY